LNSQGFSIAWGLSLVEEAYIVEEVEVGYTVEGV
jgi:hypothetical protein